MNKIVDYFVPTQDPILGIKSTNLVEKLDIDNWHSKAITQQRGNSRHYIYLSRATSVRERKRYYCLNTYDIDRGTFLSKQLFLTPDEALAFANEALAVVKEAVKSLMSKAG